MGKKVKKTILLVEDETVIAMAQANIVRSFGYDVITAISGEEAVKLVSEKKEISLILMDIDLGKGMDGTEAAKQIFEIREIPVVFLTSHSEEEYVSRVKKITRYGYVIKNSGDFVLKSSIEMAYELFDANRALIENMDAFRDAKNFAENLIETANTIVVGLDNNGDIKWNAFLGSSNTDGCGDITLDQYGKLYITGYSYAEWGSPINGHNGGGKGDAFVAKLLIRNLIPWRPLLLLNSTE